MEMIYNSLYNAITIHRRLEETFIVVVYICYANVNNKIHRAATIHSVTYIHSIIMYNI
jgi:hypothetical protein